MKDADQKLAPNDQITISQSFEFSASHELSLLPASHKCRRNHGHNYTVTASALIGGGATGDLTPLGDYLAATFDHRLLNEQVAFHPTSELLASHLATWFQNNMASNIPITLVAIVISETASTSARYNGVTGEITISKTFKTRYRDITLILTAGELDEVGFITDFGDLKPFCAYLHGPEAETALRAISPALVTRLAGWFVNNMEPKIRGRLVSLEVDTGTTTGLWERGDGS